MSTNGMQNNTSMGIMPHYSENDTRSIELVAAHNSEYKYTNNGKTLAIVEANAPKNFKPLDTTFTKTIQPINLNIEFANYLVQDDIISDKVAKNIEEGIADINAGRTYTTDQVRKMLGLH